MNKTSALMLLSCLLPSAARADDSPGLQLVESRRIWDRAPHNAFTDLIRFHDRWYCVFRDGKGSTQMKRLWCSCRTTRAIACCGRMVSPATGTSARHARRTPSGAGRSSTCVSAAHALAGLKKRDGEKATTAAEKAAKDLINRLLRLARDEDLLDREFDQYGLNALRPLLDEMRGLAGIWSKQARLPKKDEETKPPDLDAAAERLRPVLREFAKLDGCNVWRRSREVRELPGKLRPTDEGKPQRKKTQLSWIVPVRVWALRDTWGEDPEANEKFQQATHDKQGLVRRDYLAWLRDTLQVFDADGMVKKEYLHLLDPACLEALDLNLSAGRHKPFEFDPGDHPPPAELIGELQGIHGQIQQRLEKLLAMVEGKA